MHPDLYLLPAVCEKCGAIGVKHAFYGKERKFCSLSCARGPLPPVQAMAETQQMEKEVLEETTKEMMPVPEVKLLSLYFTLPHVIK